MNFPFRHLMVVGIILIAILMASDPAFNGLDILAIVMILVAGFIWVRLQAQSGDGKNREGWHQ